MDQYPETPRMQLRRPSFAPVLVILFLAPLLTSQMVQPAQASGRAVLEVGPGQTYATIDEALWAGSQADTVLVHPGSYEFTEKRWFEPQTIISVGGPSVTTIFADDRTLLLEYPTTLQGFTIHNTTLSPEEGVLEDLVFTGVLPAMERSGVHDLHMRNIILDVENDTALALEKYHFTGGHGLPSVTAVNNYLHIEGMQVLPGPGLREVILYDASNGSLQNSSFLSLDYFCQGGTHLRNVDYNGNLRLGGSEANVSNVSGSGDVHLDYYNGTATDLEFRKSNVTLIWDGSYRNLSVFDSDTAITLSSMGGTVEDLQVTNATLGVSVHRFLGQVTNFTMTNITEQGFDFDNLADVTGSMHNVSIDGSDFFVDYRHDGIREYLHSDHPMPSNYGPFIIIDSDVTLRHSSVENGSYGAYVYEARSSTIRNLTVENTSYGIGGSGSTATWIRNSQLSNLTLTGVLLSSGSYTRISDLAVDGATTGVSLDNEAYSWLHDNSYSNLTGTGEILWNPSTALLESSSYENVAGAQSLRGGTDVASRAHVINNTVTGIAMVDGTFDLNNIDVYNVSNVAYWLDDESILSDLDGCRLEGETYYHYEDYTDTAITLDDISMDLRMSNLGRLSIVGGSNVTLEGLNTSGNSPGFGLFIGASDNITVTDLATTGPGGGVRVLDSETVSLSDTAISRDGQPGLSLRGSHVDIQRVSITGSGDYDVDFEDEEVGQNYFQDVWVGNEPFVVLRDLTSGTQGAYNLSRENVSNLGRVIVYNSSDLVLESIDLTAGADDGIGLNLIESERIVLRDSSITGYNGAVQLRSATDFHGQDLHLSHGEYGIRSVLSTGATVDNVTVTGFEEGINSNQGIDINGSTFTHNLEAVDVGGPFLFTHNWFENNDLAIEASSLAGVAYDNAFVNNGARQVEDRHGATWSTTPVAGPNIMGGPFIGGNYWSEFYGLDFDGDGLAENSRYTLDSSGVQQAEDQHPIVWEPAAPPIVLFSAPSTALAGEPVFFEDLSFDLEYDLLSWTWDFGDGAFSSDRYAHHSYTTPGTYTVTLDVSNEEGSVGDHKRTIEILDPSTTFPAPEAHLGIFPASAEVHETVSFLDLSSSEDPILQRSWDLGDGSNQTTASLVLTHTYDTAGSYDIALEITTEYGLTDQATGTIIIHEAPTEPPATNGTEEDPEEEESSSPLAGVTGPGTVVPAALSGGLVALAILLVAFLLRSRPATPRQIENDSEEDPEL